MASKTVQKKPLTNTERQKRFREQHRIIKTETPEKKEAGGKPKQVKLVSTEELAQIVGVDVRRIQQLTKEGVIKKEAAGKYDFDRNVQSLLRYYRQRADSRRSADSEEMKNAKERQAIAKARLQELELAQLEGTLYKAEDIERVMGAALSRLRINLLAIPLGVAPLIKDIKKMMAEEESLQQSG